MSKSGDGTRFPPLRPRVCIEIEPSSSGGGRWWWWPLRLDAFRSNFMKMNSPPARLLCGISTGRALAWRADNNLRAHLAAAQTPGVCEIGVTGSGGRQNSITRLANTPTSAFWDHYACCAGLVRKIPMAAMRMNGGFILFARVFVWRAGFWKICLGNYFRALSCAERRPDLYAVAQHVPVLVSFEWARTMQNKSFAWQVEAFINRLLFIFNFKCLWFVLQEQCKQLKYLLYCLACCYIFLMRQ